MKPSQILKIHLLLVGIVIINSIAKYFFEIGLIIWLDNTFKIMIVLTGLWLFFKNLKPFRKVNFYFTIYPLSIVLGLIAIIFKGILGAIILSILLHPFNLNQAKYNKNGIRISIDANGFGLDFPFRG